MNASGRVLFKLKGASSPDPCTVYVDMKALRNDRVSLVEKGAPHSIPLMESGKVELFTCYIPRKFVIG